MGVTDFNVSSERQEESEKGNGLGKSLSSGPSEHHISVATVGRENIADALPPHESFEGRHRWDPAATWTPQEEAVIVRKTDLYLLSWLCLMVWDNLNTGMLWGSGADSFTVFWSATRSRKSL